MESLITEYLPQVESYNYTYDQFANGFEPYQKLFSYVGNDFSLRRELNKMEENAKRVGFKRFFQIWKSYRDSEIANIKIEKDFLPNLTQFAHQPFSLRCGEWTASDSGVWRLNKRGEKEYACTHPIMPVARLTNIDNGESKIELWFQCASTQSRCQKLIVDKVVISSNRTIINLAKYGIAVTSTTASALVDYLSCLQAENYDRIPEISTVSRMGWMERNEFVPFVDDIEFDGDPSFSEMYKSISHKGSSTAWYGVALECRKASVAARIILAASFASPLLHIVGALPFFVHIWSPVAGVGKTVALFLAASVWADPGIGRYIVSHNTTKVGSERVAAFLNNLPLCIDELQLAANKVKFDDEIYHLAQGVGRARGTKTGAIERISRWRCCILSTGESPMISNSSGAGAINRVLDVECKDKVIQDGHRVANILQSNYGHAGELFIRKICSNEKIWGQVMEIYECNLEDCMGSNLGMTDKQAGAVAAILTADYLATEWIFKDDLYLMVNDFKDIVATQDSASLGKRAYAWLLSWVSQNQNNFMVNGTIPVGAVFGAIESSKVFIIRKVYDEAMEAAGFSPKSILTYLESENLIIERKDGRGFTVSKRIGTTSSDCVCLRLPDCGTVGLF